MRPYEVMVIFNADLEEGDIRQRVERVHELVRTGGGTPGNVSHWGRRTFAYEIQHRSEGYYVVLETTAEPATMSEVDRFLALEDVVLRHKVIRQPDHVAGRAAAKQRRRPTPAGRTDGPRPSGPRTAAAPPRTAEPPVGVVAGVAGDRAIAAGAAETPGTGADAASGGAEPAVS